MKLRLRSLETKQTHRIETPNPCSLHQLKQILFHTLNPHNPSSSSSSSIENLHLSLNRKDELQSSSSDEEETLQSLGITSGDLIFFTLNPSAFSTRNSQITLNPFPNLQSEITPPQEGKPNSSETQNSQITLKPSPSSQSENSPPQEGKPTSDETQNHLNTLESPLNVQPEDAQKEELIENEEKVVDGEDYMEVDDVNTYEGNVGKSFSVPGFLRKVFTEELGDGGGRDHELLVIAIHAVLLESGFVGFDPVSKMELNGFQFRNNWPAGLFALSLYYTLPAMISSRASESINTVVLKFHSLSKSVTVYGSLSNRKSVVHRVNFNEDKLVPFLNVAWANCGMGDEISMDEGVSGTSAEKKVFEFWRNVKDGLALPLLIDLCEEAGFMLPACFMRLPTELKLKILEFLPGDDVAKVSCVSSELRYLSSSDDLWKKKYVEQFGDAERAGEGGYWKKKFVNCWESRKRRKLLSRVGVHRVIRPIMPRRMPPIIGGDHDIWPHLGVIGGDYDRLPQPLGGILPGLVGRMPPVRRHPLPSHAPRCNLGGSGNRSFI